MHHIQSQHQTTACAAGVISCNTKTAIAQKLNKILVYIITISCTA